MKRYIIQEKKTGKFLKRVKSYGTRNEWVQSVDDSTLITTKSAASQIAKRFLDKSEPPYRFKFANQSWRDYPVRVIEVEVLLYRAGTQPLFGL